MVERGRGQVAPRAACSAPGSYLHYRGRRGAGLSFPALPSPIPNLAAKRNASWEEITFQTRRVVCAWVRGAGARGAPVIAILPGNENERADPASTPRGRAGGGQGRPRRSRARRSVPQEASVLLASSVVDSLWAAWPWLPGR